MFSHSLSSRPLVVDGDAEIKISLSDHHDNPLDISCDGHESHPVLNSQQLIIRKHPSHLRLLHPTNYRYYDTLRSKLGWEAKHQG
jgi:NAD+ kinase